MCHRYRRLRAEKVLCYEGYLTPVNPADGLHCIGASHQRNDSGTEYREEEQTANKQRLLASLPDVSWPEMVDISAGESRQDPLHITRSPAAGRKCSRFCRINRTLCTSG